MYNLNLGRPGKFHNLLMTLEQLRLSLVQALYDAMHDLARLVRQLILRRAENLLENADEFGSEALDSGLVALVCISRLASTSTARCGM